MEFNSDLSSAEFLRAWMALENLCPFMHIEHMIFGVDVFDRLRFNFHTINFACIRTLTGNGNTLMWIIRDLRPQ